MIGGETKHQPRRPAANMWEYFGPERVVRFDMLEGLPPLVVPIIHLKQGERRGPTTFMTQLSNQINLIRECCVLFKAGTTLAQRAGLDQLKNARPRAFHGASNGHHFGFIGKSAGHRLASDRSMTNNSGR